MLENSTSLASKFSHAPARDLAAFARTMNMGSQGFAVNGTINVLHSASTIPAVINGAHFIMAADALLTISTDLQLTIWLTGSSYTAEHMRYVVNPNSGLKQWYKCILAHTAAAANKPDENNLRADALWKTYWTRSTQTAEQASGDYIASGDSRYYLALATAAGETTLVTAGPAGTLAADVELVIPNFEPEFFVAIGTLLINSAAFTLGTTSTAGISAFAQLIGPVFPTGAGIDQN